MRDVVYAGAGNDSVGVGYGNDLVFGQEGDGTIAGGFRVDQLLGQAGNDVITGSPSETSCSAAPAATF